MLFTNFSYFFSFVINSMTFDLDMFPQTSVCPLARILSFAPTKG